MPRTKPSRSCCSPKPELRNRPLIDPDRAGEVGALFKVLANGTRLRLLHALARADELCVSDIAQAVEMKPQAVSNQLIRLVDRGILGSRRNGNNVYYRITDPCVANLLDQGLCLMEDAKERAT
jgi:DNA-binding transcriptional ArsR family regulator